MSLGPLSAESLQHQHQPSSLAKPLETLPELDKQNHQQRFPWAGCPCCRAPPSLPAAPLRHRTGDTNALGLLPAQHQQGLEPNPPQGHSLGIPASSPGHPSGAGTDPAHTALPSPTKTLPTTWEELRKELIKLPDSSQKTNKKSLKLLFLAQGCLQIIQKYKYEKRWKNLYESNFESV